jgi:Methyltransferase FkbM domain
MNNLNFLRPVTINRKKRLGRHFDGGYIVYERLLEQTDILLTYGVGWETSFEEHFNNLTNKTVLMFDPTMFGKYLLDLKLVKQRLLQFRFGAMLSYFHWTWQVWRKKKKLESKNIFFINEGISSIKADKYDTFVNHLERFKLDGKRIILKIDIEGGEYDIFADKTIYSHLAQVNQLIIEFHNLKQRLRDLKAISAELGKSFSLAHIHANNFSPTFTLYDLAGNGEKDVKVPDVLEILWIKADMISKEDISDEITTYPISQLDYPNNPGKPDHAIGFI